MGPAGAQAQAPQGRDHAVEVALVDRVERQRHVGDRQRAVLLLLHELHDARTAFELVSRCGVEVRRKLRERRRPLDFTAITDHAEQIVAGVDARDGKVAIEGWAETSEMTVLDLARRFGVEERLVIGYLGTHGLAHALENVLRAERDALLAEAEIVLLPFPFPLDLAAVEARAAARALDLFDEVRAMTWRLLHPRP